MCNVPNHISLQLNNAAFFSRRELVFTSRDIVITSCLHWLFTMSWLRSNQTSSIVVRVANTWQTFKYVQNKLVKPLPTFHSSMPRKKIHQNVVYTNLLYILPSCWFTTAAIFFTTCELDAKIFSRSRLVFTTSDMFYVRSPRREHGKRQKNAALHFV